MIDRDPARRDVDDLLHEAGAHWRARQLFEAVPLAPRNVRPYGRVASGRLIPAVGLAAVIAIAGAAIAFGPLRFSGAGSEATSSDEPGASHPMASAADRTDPAELEVARMRVIEAVNTDPSNFGIPYLDDGGTLVVQYFNEVARAAVQAQVSPGLTVRWEKVEYSRTELQRIASEIIDLDLGAEGVFAVSSGTIRNRVIVYVAPWGSVDAVHSAVARYGSAVLVEVSSVPVIQPALPTAQP